MEKILNFFADNGFEFGDKDAPEIRPNNVFSILKLGMKNYYETFQSELKNNNMLNYFYKVRIGGEGGQEFINPGIGCSHEFLARYYSSITYTQLFFELYIVEFLDSVSTFITRKECKEKEFLNELMNNTENYSSKRSIQYSTILKRLKIIFENESTLPKNLHIPVKYSFLKNHITSLEVLRELRNAIMHSGRKVLFHYAYEVLFVNHLFPIIKEVILRGENIVTMNRNLYCELNIIDELIKIKLPYDYLRVEINEEIKQTLNRVNHLKELGRASFNNPLFMGEWGNEDLKKNLAPQNERIRRKAEVEANIVHAPLQYYERFHCPCCGTNTLMTFDYWIETSNNRTRPNKAECFLCSYTISLRIGEPFEYGIMNVLIFNYID